MLGCEEDTDLYFLFPTLLQAVWEDNIDPDNMTYEVQMFEVFAFCKLIFFMCYNDLCSY